MIEDGLRTMCMWLCKFIYSIIAWLYELFMNLSRVELLTSDNIKPIYERITMILAIIMVFYVTFEFVKYVIQPETLTDKEKGVQKITVKMVIVVVLIAFIPTIFTYAYRLQGLIIDNQVFSKVILGKQNVNSNQFGRSFSASLFQRFYTANTNLDDLGDCDGISCEQLISHNITELAANGSTTHFTLGLNEKEKRSVQVQGSSENIEEYKIDFNPILAVGVGGFVAWMLMLYCVDVGVRVAQLAYLQIIAPIPIIGYLSPKKDGIFQKWTRQCFTTYLDLFIRIAIIYFVLLISEILGNALNDGTLLEGLGAVSPMMKTFIYIALLMGLLMFAKKAPKMIGELFPSMGAASGNFGLKAGDRGLDRLFGTALGAATGASWGLATGVAQGARRMKKLDSNATFGQKAGAFLAGATLGAGKGTIGGLGRGAYNGMKKGNPIKNGLAGAKNQAKANQRFGNMQENGYGIFDQAQDRIRNAFNMPSRIEELEGQKAPLSRKKDTYSNLSKTNDSIRDYCFKKAQDKGLKSASEYLAAEGRLKRLQEDKDLIESLGGENSERYKAEISDAKKSMKELKDKATNEYFDIASRNPDGTFKDGNLAGLIAERENMIEDYNRYASPEHQISDTATIKIGDRTITKKISDMTAEEYDEYVKQIAKKAEVDLGIEIGNITSRQESFKRQQSGSGIGDKK